MDLRDLIIAPIVIFLVYVIGYIFRPRLADDITRRYFFAGLTVKIIGAIALGVLYQFYYNTGDTFNYHTSGSRQIWKALFTDPDTAFKLFINLDGNYSGVYKYAQNITFFQDPSSYVIVRIAAFFDLLTFSSYCGTAVLFAVVSFLGSWLLFLTFYSLKPHLHQRFAIATLFIPTVIFWGSGILKDSITMACIGAATFVVYRVFIKRDFKPFHVVILIVSLYGLLIIKIYILMTFLPALILWIFLYYYVKINPLMLRILAAPFVFSGALAVGFFAIQKAGEDNPKYSLETIAQTAKITAYDIRFYTGKDAGSGYTLGELDGTWSSMLLLMPAAVNVTLFRPYLWEVKNLLMLLSSLESTAFLILTLFAIVKIRGRWTVITHDPTIIFCLVFGITFAFAVGVSTYNFGTLMRYKIPVMPFYLSAIVLALDSRRPKKLEVFAITE